MQIYFTPDLRKVATQAWYRGIPHPRQAHPGVLSGDVSALVSYSLQYLDYSVLFLPRFEGGGHTGTDKHGIEGFPTLDRLTLGFSLETCLSWFDMVLAALDCYTWVFGENLLSPGDLFGSKYLKFSN